MLLYIDYCDRQILNIAIKQAVRMYQCGMYVRKYSDF